MREKWILCLVAVMLSLAACSSSDSGDGNSNPSEIVNPGNDPGGTSEQQLSNVNGGLGGLVWLTQDGQYLNVDTGDQVQLSGHSVYPSRDAQEYIELIDNYRVSGFSSCGRPFSARMNIRNTKSGLLQASVEDTVSFYGPAKLSPDKQTIALFAANNEGCNDGDVRLYLYSRSGDFIILANDNVGSFDWMPDNRLAFFYFGENGVELVVETQGNTLNFSTVVNMSGQLGGSPSNLEISPDGKTAVFEVVTGTPGIFETLTYRDATVWRVNMDGSGLEKLIDTSRTDPDTSQYKSDPRINQPVWSPDGQWLLATENYFSGGIVTPIAPGIYDVATVRNEELTYIIPAQNDFVRLPPQSYSSTGLRPLLGKSTDGSVAAPVALNPIGDLRWTSPDVTPVEVVGALPSASTGLNRGMTGSIYAFNKQSLTVLKYEVGTDQLTEIILLPTDAVDVNEPIDLYVSPDHSRFILRYLVAFDNDHLLVFNANGQQTNSLSLNRSDTWFNVSSDVYISPVQANLAAWRYSESSDGGDRGIIVANTDTGEFILQLTDREYLALSFQPNGDLLISSEGDIYRLQWQNGQLSEPTLILSIGERIYDLYANPVTSEILYRVGYFYYTVTINGTNQKRLFSHTGASPFSVRWSVDGGYIGFAWAAIGQDRPSTTAMYVMSSDTNNLALSHQSVSQSVFEIDQSQMLRDWTAGEDFHWY